MNENWTSTEDLALQRARSESSRLLGSSIDDLNLTKESAQRGYTVNGVPFPPIENGEITAIELTGADESYQSDVLDGTELWTVDLDALIEVEGPLLKQDVSEIPEAGTVVDAEWNRHYMMVSFPLTVRLRYDVRVDSAETTDGQLVDVTLVAAAK